MHRSNRIRQDGSIDRPPQGGRDPQEGRGLVDRKTAEVPQLDDLHLRRRKAPEALGRFVERATHLFLQRDGFERAADGSFPRAADLHAANADILGTPLLPGLSIDLRELFA